MKLVKILTKVGLNFIGFKSIDGNFLSKAAVTAEKASSAVQSPEATWLVGNFFARFTALR
jgi:hypothetical protein